jgi:hypothetical protein
VVEGCGHVGEGAGGGQRVLTLSTGRAGARQRIELEACADGGVVALTDEVDDGGLEVSLGPHQRVTPAELGWQRQ